MSPTSLVTSLIRAIVQELFSADASHRLCPSEVFQIQYQPALLRASGPGCVGPAFGIRRDSAPSSRIHTCFRACCNSTRIERFGIETLRGISSQSSNALHRLLGIRYPVRINLGCWNRSSFNVSPVHSAARPPSALNRSAGAGSPNAAWMLRPDLQSMAHAHSDRAAFRQERPGATRVHGRSERPFDASADSVNS